MRTIPRRAWQALTLCLIVSSACLWWYLETRSNWFLIGMLGLIVVGSWDFRHEIVSVRTAKKDARGITTLLSDMTMSETLLLMVLTLMPFLFSIYAVAKERALFPSDAYQTDPDPVAWFMFAAVTLAFAFWVAGPMEKAFWVVTTAFFSSYGLRALLLRAYVGSQFFGRIAAAFWVVTTLTELALLLSGLWMVYKRRGQGSNMFKKKDQF